MIPGFPADASRQRRKKLDLLVQTKRPAITRGGIGVSGGHWERAQVLRELHSFLCRGKVGESHHSR